jgi:hypothetical protein
MSWLRLAQTVGLRERGKELEQLPPSDSDHQRAPRCDFFKGIAL